MTCRMRHGFLALVVIAAALAGSYAAEAPPPAPTAGPAEAQAIEMFQAHVALVNPCITCRVTPSSCSTKSRRGWCPSRSTLDPVGLRLPQVSTVKEAVR